MTSDENGKYQHSPTRITITLASISYSIYSIEYQKGNIMNYLTFIVAEVWSLFSTQFLLLTPRAPVDAYKLLFTS